MRGAGGGGRRGWKGRNGKKKDESVERTKGKESRFEGERENGIKIDKDTDRSMDRQIERKRERE